MKFLPAFLVCLILTSCEFKAEVKQDGHSTTSSSKIRNGIDFKTKGDIKVSQAFLLYEDGTLVPSSNEAKINQAVRLRLIVEGWKAVDGKVKLGASEKIETNTGKVFLDEKDLLGNNLLDAEDAKALTLKAVITGIDQLYDYFVISFRVWDKSGTGEVTGSYRLHLQ